MTSEQAETHARDLRLAQALEIHLDASLQDPEVLQAIRQDVVQIARWTGVDPADVTAVLGCLETWDVAGPSQRTVAADETGVAGLVVNRAPELEEGSDEAWRVMH